jgi:hypothetical protein
MTNVFDEIRERLEKGVEPVTIEEIFEHRNHVAAERIRRRRRIIVVLATPVTAAVVVTCILTLHGTPLAPPTSPTLVLNRMSKLADAQLPVEPAPGQFVYTNRTGFQFEPGAFGPGGPSSPSYWVSFGYRAQLWESPTGNGEAVQSDGPTAPARTSDEAAWEAAGRPALAGPTTRTSQGQQPEATDAVDGLDLATLSSDPRRLAQQLEEAVDPEAAVGPSQEPRTVLSLAEALLDAWQLQPSVRSAVFHVLSTQPGVTVQIGARNHAGQAGTGISAVEDGIRSQIIVDPTTSVEIGYSSVVVDPAKAGYPTDAAGLAGWVVITPPVVVDTLGATK